VVNGRLDLGAYEAQGGKGQRSAVTGLQPIKLWFSNLPRTVHLSVQVSAADASSTGPVNEGHVIFSALGQTLVAPVQDGTASATLTIPGGTAGSTPTESGGTPAASYPLTATYTDDSPDPGHFADSSASTTLTITPAAVVTAAEPQTAKTSAAAQTLTLTARVTDPNNPADVVTEGTVTFTVHDSSGKAIGSPVSAPVIKGAAAAPYVLPAGLHPGSYTIAVSYADPRATSAMAATTATP
jgi:hypothetical protein